MDTYRGRGISTGSEGVVILVISLFLLGWLIEMSTKRRKSGEFGAAAKSRKISDFARDASTFSEVEQLTATFREWMSDSKKHHFNLNQDFPPFFGALSRCPQSEVARQATKEAHGSMQNYFDTAFGSEALVWFNMFFVRSRPF